MSLRIASTLLFIIAVARVAAGQPAPSLTHVRGDLYLIQDGNQSGVVYVAPDGILIADPLSITAGRWLRTELASRFPGKPVRYVVYTSALFERVAGGSAFPEATFVGHARFGPELLQAARTLPASLVPLDANRNERLETAERSGRLGAQLSEVDVNSDGVLISREVYRVVPYATTFIGNRTMLALGTRRVEAVNTGAAFTTPALYFPDERILYAGTNPAFAPNGFSFGDGEPRGVLEWLRDVAKLPFDSVVTGRGDTLPRNRVDALLPYVEQLYAASVDAYSRGASVQRAASDALLQKYGGNPVDAQRRTSVESIFRSLRVSRIELQGAGIAQWMAPNDAYCEGYTNCISGGEIVGGSAGIRFTKSRFGVLIEGVFGDQFTSQRHGELDDEVYAQRSSRGSFLLRAGTSRPTALSIDLLVGPTIIVASTSGVTRVKEAVPPFGGRHPFSERTTQLAITAGVNVVLPLTRAISVIVPLRATALPSDPPQRWPGRFDAHGGIGLSIRLAQSVK